ncbi:hypothetical protein F4678DRAFT_472172 [Xylaria arbuscula]|nr:hypothetical protein F4678DRAFT_472172 [Xylaria arbuscula]
MAARGTIVSPATFDLIETWIGQQRQASTPVADKVQTALLGLEDAIKTDPTLQTDLELDDTNWVGMLQEYRAAHPLRGSQEVPFAESPFDPSGRGFVRWQCRVTLDEAPGVVFPNADAALPSFARKKDAKQYAAKCAIEWLRAKGLMPQHGVRFPKGYSTPHQLQGQPKSPQPKGFSNTPAQGQILSPARIQSTPTRSPFSPFDDSQASAANQAAELCKALGINPPRYDIATTTIDGFYRGRADFGDEGDFLPFDASELALTEDVMGKKAAKELIAEKLVKLLLAEKEKRDARNQAFLARD